MSNRIFRKQVARNKQTGFPVPGEEEVVVNGKMIIIMSGAAIFTTVLTAWRQLRGKRKQKDQD